jgi:hypothetical protein
MLDPSALPSTSAVFRTILRFDFLGLKSPAFPRLSAQTCVLAVAPKWAKRSPDGRFSPNLCASPFSTKVFSLRYFNDLAQAVGAEFACPLQGRKQSGSNREPGVRFAPGPPKQSLHIIGAPRNVRIRKRIPYLFRLAVMLF